MKKLFLFVAVAAMTLSCSKDDNNSSSDSIKFTVDGASKTLSNVVVNEQPDGQDTYLTATGTIGTSTSEIFSFEVYKGDVGADVIDFISYMKDGQSYYPSSNFAAVVQTNSNNKLKGTFSGTMSNFDGSSADIVITNGTFNISY